MQFYKYEHTVVKFVCEFLVLLTINMLWHIEVMFNQLLNLLERYTHKFYYYVLIIIELYFNNFNYFSNFRPLTCFSVMIPETV